MFLLLDVCERSASSGRGAGAGTRSGCGKLNLGSARRGLPTPHLPALQWPESRVELCSKAPFLNLFKELLYVFKVSFFKDKYTAACKLISSYIFFWTLLYCILNHLIWVRRADLKTRSETTVPLNYHNHPKDTRDLLNIYLLMLRAILENKGLCALLYIQASHNILNKEVNKQTAWVTQLY